MILCVEWWWCSIDGVGGWMLEDVVGECVYGMVMY